MADLVELDMVDFDLILRMDWLHACYVSIKCRTRAIKFQIPNKQWNSSSIVPKGCFICTLRQESLILSFVSIT